MLPLANTNPAGVVAKIQDPRVITRGNEGEMEPPPSSSNITRFQVLVL